MAGRPRKRSSEREEAILNALRVGNTRRAAAAAAEVSEDTLARWLTDAVFSGAVEKAEADAELRFLGQVAKHAASSPQAAQWWLERRRQKDYRQRTGIELSGLDGGPIQTEDVTVGLNDHEKSLLRSVIDDVLKTEELA